MNSVPLSVCAWALALIQAHDSKAFAPCSKRDAWIVHGLEDLGEGTLVFQGAYVELGCIFFVGDDAYAYKIRLDKRELSRA